MPTSEDSFPKSLPIDRNRELFRTAREETYKSVDGVDLPVYIWGPDPAKA
ncbi:MAG: alpha/beta hydrolase, partial [Verrucomicrobiaceae bacterium]|nr:alpha/beta hydrolase [Verrucomicrobiaceae bacterium]